MLFLKEANFSFFAKISDNVIEDLPSSVCNLSHLKSLCLDNNNVKQVLSGLHWLLLGCFIVLFYSFYLYICFVSACWIPLCFINNLWSSSKDYPTAVTAYWLNIDWTSNDTFFSTLSLNFFEHNQNKWGRFARLTEFIYWNCSSTIHKGLDLSSGITDCPYCLGVSFFKFLAFYKLCRLEWVIANCLLFLILRISSWKYNLGVRNNLNALLLIASNFLW